MSFYKAIKNKKTQEIRKKMWRGGVAHAPTTTSDWIDADSMPEDREEQLARYGEMEEEKPSAFESYLKQHLYGGGEVEESEEQFRTENRPLSRQDELNKIDELMKQKYAKGGMVESQQAKLGRFMNALKRRSR